MYEIRKVVEIFRVKILKLLKFVHENSEKNLFKKNS